MDYLNNVKCTVSDCYYNHEGKYCIASAIEVNTMHNQLNAGTSEYTMCKTYKPFQDI